MSKRSFDGDSKSSPASGHKICNTSKAGERLIIIDHTNQLDHQYHQTLLKNKSLNDTDTDIKFIVEAEEINAHKEVIEILKDKRQLVRDAVERDRLAAQKERSEAANVFQMSGTTINGFRRLLEYIYTGKVNCDLKSGIELATTADKLKFHPLVASLAQHLAQHKNWCLNVNTIDDLYHIAKNANNRDLIRSCAKFMDDKAYDLNGLFLKRDTQPKDAPNVLIYAYDKSRYNNYIHFLLPESTEICFNVSVSVDRTNWSVVLKNDEIWSKFWNWVYFEERRLKYIRIKFTEQKGGDRFDIRSLRDDHFLAKRANVDLEFDKQKNYLIPKHDIIKFPIRDTKLVFDDKLEDGFTYCMSNASVKDKEKRYYYHNVGDNHFLEFYLSQTCLIDKFRLRLWDLDDRTYDFRVEIKSEDDEDWEVIRDNNREVFKGKSSWQTIQLRSRRAVRWIRITGLKSPPNDPEFAIIDFECPANQHNK